jgi:hypothetical protein
MSLISIITRSVIVFAAFGLTSCGPVELSDSARGSTVEVGLGEEIELTLHVAGPGKYSTPSISSESVRFIKITIPREQAPGGEAQDFHFKAEATGSSLITIPYVDPSDTVMVEPFEFTVDVK